MKTSVKFNNVNTLFSKALKQKINNYFNEESRTKTGDRHLLIKAAVLLGLALVLYIILIFVQPHWLISALLCIVLGVNFAAIGFNIMHDAGHGSFSDSKKLNSILSYSLNLLGGNIYLWKLKHNIAHHTYTNIDGEDHDIEIKFMRVHPDQPLRKHHRFQHLYFLLLYSISYLAWIFYQDYEKYFRQKLGNDSAPFHFPFREKVVFWISKVIHFFVFIVVPVLVLGWLPTLTGLLITGVTCGLCLATVFQLAHVVSDTELKTVEGSKVEAEWMVHQLNSTANFATRSTILTWLLGGLNFQVEHHLFPKISHVHYPAINAIVKDTCMEYGIKYVEYATFLEAFKSHVRVIRRMSR